MDAILFAINLEVMLLQMRILERRAERKFSENGVPNKSLKLVVDKLVRDRNIIKEISLRTLVELAEGGEWHTLKQAVDMLENNANSAISLRMKNENLKTCLDNVSTDLQRCRQQWKLNLRNYEIKIACLRDSIKDSVLNSRFQFEYVDKWLNARAESAELQVQENNTTSRPRIEYENCVHNELLRAYALQIKEREELLEYWKLRYAKDTSDLDMRLSEQCEKLRITVDRRGELESLFKLHAGEMRAWLTFKKERAARLLREERVRRAATRIQSWWRGLMVRRAIGSFRYLKNAKKSVPKAKKK